MYDFSVSLEWSFVNCKALGLNSSAASLLKQFEHMYANVDPQDSLRYRKLWYTVESS